MKDFNDLKIKLKTLNYPNNFYQQSAPLINRLLNDLIKASGAY